MKIFNCKNGFFVRLGKSLCYLKQNPSVKFNMLWYRLTEYKKYKNPSSRYKIKLITLFDDKRTLFNINGFFIVLRKIVK